MFRCLISFALLLAVEFCFGGMGQYLHERLCDGDSPKPQVTVSTVHPAKNAPRPLPTHDHDRCPTCQLLAAARIDRLPGGMILVAIADAPTLIRPVPESAPRRVFVATPIDARGPPGAIHV